MKKHILKIISLILITVCLVTVLSSCADRTGEDTNDDKVKKEGYTPLICGTSCNIPHVEHVEEYVYWVVKDYQDSRVPLTMSITVNGIEMVGSYVKSTMWCNTYITHSYESDRNRFVLTNNGELCGASFYSDEENDVDENAEITEEESVEIAKRFIKDYVDIKNFTVTKVHDFGPSYNVQFNKYTKQIVTEENVTVAVRKSGEIYYFNRQYPDEFSTETVLDFDIEKIKQAVKDRLDEYYTEAKKYRYIEYVSEEYCLTKVSKNKYAILYSVDVDSKENKPNGGFIMSDRISFIILL